MTQDNYNLLIAKLDAFVRKYYVNQLIRGSLYSLALILALFLGLNWVEYYYYMPPSVKTPLFWGFVATSLVALGVWVVQPALHYFKLGKVISHEQAAQIIGAHFSNVKDKLLNILQLRKQADGAANNRDLILASINQKSEEIKFVPFKASINLAQNRKHLRWALPPLLLLLLFSAMSGFRNASSRFFDFSKEYEKEAPFRFLLDNKELKVVQFQDYYLKVKTEGAVLPNDVFIDVNGYQYRLTKEDATTFSFTFSNVQKDQTFRLFSGDVRSTAYDLAVLKKPNMAGFDVKLDYPDYIGRTDEVLSNTGDLVIPQGTVVSWAFMAENTDNLQVSWSGGTPLSITRQGGIRFVMSKKMLTDESYKLFISNNLLPKPDSVLYNISVTPDMMPTISVEKFEDSLNRKRLFFAGDVSDDYGFRSLSFNYQIKRASGAQEGTQTRALAQPTGKQAQYQYRFDVETLGLQAGDEVSYYFEVYDNDGANGAKAARTATFVYAQPSVKEIEKEIAKNNDEIRDDLKKALAESEKVQQDLQKLRERMLQQKDVDWQMKKEAERLRMQQQNVEKQMQQAQKNFEENRKNETELNKTMDEQAQEKVAQIQEMFEQLKENSELSNLLKQIEELLQKMDKDQALEKLEDSQFSNEEMQKELERMQEMLKQLEVENAIQDQIDKLEELAKKEEDLAKDTEGGQKPQEELEKKQEELQKQLEDLQKKEKETQEKNEELKRPKQMPDTKQDNKEINKDMEDAKENLEKKDNQSASKKQKSAAQKMKEKANKMKTAQQKSKQQEIEEDIKAVRQLLENLVTLSFEQEKVMKDFQPTAETTPRYVKLVQQQKKLQGDFGLVEDSLQALAKRQVAIQSFITQKVTDVKQNMAESMTRLEDRRKLEGQDFQQRTMRDVNDLALMLAESLNQMQQQASQMSGDGSCKNPGKQPKKGEGQGQGKGGGMKDKMSEGQQNVGDMLKQLKERLEKQGKGGGGRGGAGMSKEFAEAAAKQAAMREAMRKKLKEMQERGQGEKGKELQGMMDEMEKIETELVNKQISNETLRRSQDITTRLLESEKAERERKEDEERKANVAKQQLENKTPPALEEYLKKRQSEVEQLRTVSPALRPYYKQLVEEYFRALKK